MESLKHECGLGLIRLRQPMEYYVDRYGTPLWGLRKMLVLMDKQHNRGQDGAGLASIKMNVPPGVTYLARERVFEPTPPWNQVVKNIEYQWETCQRLYPSIPEADLRWMELFPFASELYLGHVRYGTYGNNSIESCHPVVRANNWKTRTLIMAGNFNLTNVEDQFRKLVELGQHPRDLSDTVTVLERVGHFIDRAVQELFDRFKQSEPELTNIALSERIADTLPTMDVLKRSAKYWDGGFLMGGLIGHGEMFVLRDPWGIRPGYYMITDEVVAIASERAALASTFDVKIDSIQEVSPGQAIVVKRDGTIITDFVRTPREKRACSFERIYFSRPNDPDIYHERKQLGRLVVPSILEAINGEISNTIFTYVPNSASIAFRGMVEGLENLVAEQNQNIRIRSEQIIWKDTTLRTFISSGVGRKEMVSQVYNVTHGLLKEGEDHLVCIDDSIVRGTTLKESLLKILSRLHPKSIIIVSSAPQIRYPDCYGIDMSQLGHFVAFQAAVELLKERSLENILDEVYQQCLEAKDKTEENFVKRVYEPFTEQEISLQIAKMLHTPELTCPVKIVFQPLANLPIAIPNHRGDWYFSGDYPTPGGNRVVNQAFINYYERKDVRAYS